MLNTSWFSFYDVIFFWLNIYLFFTRSDNKFYEVCFFLFFFERARVCSKILSDLFVAPPVVELEDKNIRPLVHESFKKGACNHV